MVVGCSLKSLDFCRRSMLASVTRPAARNGLNGKLASLRLSPTTECQSRPPLGSGRMIAVLPVAELILPASARSTTSCMVSVSGAVLRLGDHISSPTTAPTKTSQKISIFG